MQYLFDLAINHTMRTPMLVDATRALSVSSAIQQRLGGQLSFHDLPGGTPFSLCPVSSSTDLFDTTSIELTKQPVYLCVALMLKCTDHVG